MLEVLLALTLFVVAAAVVGSAMNASLEASIEMKYSAKAADLAESVLSELASGTIPLADTPAANFPEPDQDWGYEIVAEDVVGASGMKRVIVTVKDSDPARPHEFALTQLMLDPSLQTAPALEEEEVGFEEEE